MSTVETPVRPNPLREIVDPFLNFAKAPLALWAVNINYMLEGLVYFGFLTFLAIYYNDFMGLGDVAAGRMVGLLTGGITLAMLFLGSVCDKWGVRRALILAMVIMLAGRVLLAAGPLFMPWQQGLYSPFFWVSVLGILGVVIGYGMYQPAAYASVKEFTNEKTAAMGYAMLYAVMNLGGFLPGLISPPIRKGSDRFFHAMAPAGTRTLPADHYGIQGVFWAYVGITVLSTLVLVFFLNRRTIAAARRALAWAENGEASQVTEKAPRAHRTFRQYLREHPLRDTRFSFFIFVLIPVQTLFAHNWLTLPQYVDRAFGPSVAANMEFFVNFNPILIFILTPTVAAITMKAPVYRMMILGTFVMAAPTFFLALGPNVYTLFAYIIVMSIGEAMWQPRFLQYAAEIAPEGRTGEYMGVAQFPWFLTKILTSLYSGWFLLHYCPDKGPKNTEFMWLIYGFIAMASPVCLLLAKRWMGDNLQKKLA